MTLAVPDEVKAALQAEAAEAPSPQDIFGSPDLATDGEIFRGDDRPVPQ
jgi:2-hydroxychromene-2-carboxylate isomerase